MSTTAELVQQIKTIGDRLTPIEGLLKALEKPSKAAGLSPVEFLQKMTQGGQVPMTIAGDGSMMPVVYDRRRKGIGMGSMCRAMAKLAKHDLPIGDDEVAATIKQFNLAKAALAEGSGVTGGYTVPPMLANQLMTMAAEETIVAERASKMPMTSLTLQVPFLDITTVQAVGTSPFFGGVAANWVAESQTRTETEPAFKQMELKANELSLYTVASNVLLADSAVALDSLLTQLFAAAIGWFTDFAYLQGNGVGKPLGVLNAPAAISVTRGTGGAFKFADAATMWGKLYGVANWRKKSTCWIVQQSVFPQLVQMYDAGNRPVFIPLNQGAQEMPADSGHGGYCAGYLFGAPVLCTEKLPALGTRGDVMLCDWSKYLLGDRQELQIAVSEHVAFLKNQLVWRVVWRGDGQPWLDKPITFQDASTTVSPFVVLN